MLSLCVVNYDRRGFIRLATVVNLIKQLPIVSYDSRDVNYDRSDFITLITEILGVESTHQQFIIKNIYLLLTVEKAKKLPILFNIL